MKRIIPILIVAIAATAFYFRDQWLPQPPGRNEYLGYVEGETVLIAPPVAGRLVARMAHKGATVKQGEVLFSIDPATAKLEVERSEAAVSVAQAELADLQSSGKRAPELESIAAQRREAEASLDMAEKELARASMLTSSGTAAQVRLDQAQSNVELYKARIAQFKALEEAGRLAGRDAVISRARSKVDEAEAQAAEARQKLKDLSPEAPQDALVDDTFFDPGEWVAAGQPVVSLLPKEAVTLRFFVPQEVLAKAVPGTTITYRCDGCEGELQAVITRTAAKPEFTPPVIYSETARSKLVYKVEARPVEARAELRPGLPIQVEPLK